VAILALLIFFSPSFFSSGDMVAARPLTFGEKIAVVESKGHYQSSEIIEDIRQHGTTTGEGDHFEIDSPGEGWGLPRRSIRR